MVIRVLDQNYFVLQSLPSETGLLQYVCKNVAEDDGRVYRIVMVPAEETGPGLIDWLYKIWTAGRFHELKQYASEGDSLKIVVDCGYESAVPLQDLLDAEPVSLKERTHMCTKLLERLILSDVPDFFAVHALNPETVCYTESMDCCFRFELEDLPRFAEADRQKTFSKLRAVMRKLFSQELRDKKMPELKSLLDRILQQEFSDMMEIYKAWLPIAEQYSGMDETRLESKTLSTILWSAVGKVVDFVKRWMGLVIILIAVGYLIMSIRNYMAPTKQKDIYKAVGDMTIVSGTVEETEAQNE